jgi:uncharacterized protein YigA (DUF484 family)
VSDQPPTQSDKDRDTNWHQVRDFLVQHPSLIREDEALLQELGLRINAANVVEFGPAALARLSAAKSRESSARMELEDTAEANFAAQAQSYAAVCDLLEARNHSDLARRLNDAAQLRFGLSCGIIGLEGPERTPAGWRALGPGTVDSVLGHEGQSRLGEPRLADVLFAEDAERIQSVALVRIVLWNPPRQGVLAFGSSDPEGFTPDMGAELVAFLARVVERTAERWPVL